MTERGRQLQIEQRETMGRAKARHAEKAERSKQKITESFEG